MSTSALHYGSGSILPSRSGFAASTGGARPARPGQLSQGLLDGLAGGADPETIRELSHTSAAALLDRVHHTEDPEVVARVLTLVDHEGVDVIAELWSHAEPDSLPGVLWRLYMLRTWMRKQDTTLAVLWRLGEPTVTSASVIAGVNQAPTEDDIAATASADAALAVGDRVKMDKSATIYGTMRKFAAWVYAAKLYVRGIDGNRVVVSTLKSGAITGAVDKKHLTKV